MPSQTSPRAIHRSRPRGRRWNLLFVIVPLLVVAGVAALVFFVDLDAGPELDEDLCPIAPNGSSAHRTVLLLDLRKPVPVRRAGRSLAGAVWQLASVQAAANTELEVFTVGTNPMAALHRLARLCKPDGAISNTDLAIDRAENDELECSDPSAELTDRQRAVATQFCVRRDELRTRIETIARRSSAPVDSAFLVEAIEEIGLALATETRPKSLFVFSDMLQHANWYSHVELAPTDWGFSRYVSVREEQNSRIGPRPPALADLAVTLYYMPRQGITDSAPAARAHRQFWREFFVASASAEPRFSSFPPAPGYETAPLMSPAEEADVITQARLRLQREREAAERELLRLTQERAALENDVNPLPAPAQPPLAQPEPPAAQAQSPATAAEGVVERPTVADAAAASGPPVAPPQEQPAAAQPAQPEPAEALLADESPSAPPVNRQTCRAQLLPRYTLRAPPYPGRGRVDYGSATITVSYAIDDEGNTVDDSIEVLNEASSATRPTYLNLFVGEARDIASRYRFRFDESSDDVCTRSQRLTTQFQFQYQP